MLIGCDYLDTMNFVFGQTKRQHLSEEVEACLLCPTNNINNNHNNHNDYHNNNHNHNNNKNNCRKL